MNRPFFPVLISIPHGGDWIPPEIRKIINLGKSDIFEDGDAFTRDLYNFGSLVEATVDTRVARAAVDLNRAPDDLPPANPDGVLKTVTAMGKQVYKENLFPHRDLATKLLDKYYFPYHKKLEVLSNRSNLKLALDCHSMAPVGPPTAKDTGRVRPLICLSNRGDLRGLPCSGERATCSPETINRFAKALISGFAVEGIEIGEKLQINMPFSGGYIVRKHGQKGIPWLQIEINRSLYLDRCWFNMEELTLAPERIEQIQKSLINCFQLFFDS